MTYLLLFLLIQGSLILRDFLNIDTYLYFYSLCMKFVCEIFALKFVYIYLDFVVLILESVKWLSYQKYDCWINEILTYNI